MKEPIRILHVFGRLDRGGAETMIMNLYRNIDRSVVQFDFIKHTEDICDYDDEIYSLGGRIYTIIRYTGKNHFKYKSAWKKFFEENNQYKVIHGHMRSTASIYLKIAKTFNVFTIAHSHNTSSGKGLTAIIKNIMQYPIRYVADYLLACSESAGRWLYGRRCIKKKNYTIFNNAIDTSKFSYSSDVRVKKRKELNVQDCFVVGHVGRFHPQKNHEFLIKIFAEILKIKSNAILMLVGDGELRNEIMGMATNLGISNNVMYLGVRDDVHEIFQAMDVFVFPSQYEGLGIVVIEAQAAGLPCIVSDVIPKEVDISKLILRVNLRRDPKYWAKCVLEHSINNERCKIDDEIKKHGYDIYDTSKAIQDLYTNFYSKVVNK